MKNKLLLLFVFFFSCSIPNFKVKENSKEIINFTYDYYFLENDSIQYDLEYSIPYNKLVFRKDIYQFYTNIRICLEANASLF